MKDEQKPKAVCKRCARMLKHGETEYCLKCKIELAEQNIPDNDIISSQPHKKPNKILAIGKWVLLISFSVLIIVNSVILVKLFLQRNPKEFVVPDMRKDVVLCLSNLSDISSLLQEGKLPPDSIVCPLSGKPYRIEIKNGDTFVYCPNPEKHKLKNLRVSKNNPIPEVVK